MNAIEGETYETPSKEIKEYLTETATNTPTIPERNIMTKKYGRLNPVFL